MSRLFSQLENIGHDRTDVERPAAEQEVGTTGADPAPTQTGPHNLSAAPNRPNYSPVSTVQPQIPGYAIASQLSLSSRPVAPAAASRATWPVRLWFLSLLALIGLSLAMLLSPRDDTTTVQRPAPRSAGMAPEPTVDEEPSPPIALPSLPPKAEATVEPKPTTSAAPIARPVNKPGIPHQPSQPPADQPATAPRAPAGDPGCSAAMAAMNLCSASHP